MCQKKLILAKGLTINLKGNFNVEHFQKFYWLKLMIIDNGLPLYNDPIQITFKGSTWRAENSSIVKYNYT